MYAEWLSFIIGIVEREEKSIFVLNFSFAHNKDDALNFFVE